MSASARPGTSGRQGRMGEEQTSFTRLYERFYPQVLAYMLRRLAPDQARDVTDETFLVAWRRRADLPDDPLPWLLVTAKNTMADELRRNRRQDAIRLELVRCARGTQPGADVAALERITLLTALAELPLQDRELLMSTVWDGLTAREAARLVNCSTATFAVRLHRARRRLAAALARLDTQRHATTAAQPSQSVRDVPLRGRVFSLRLTLGEEQQ